MKNIIQSSKNYSSFKRIAGNRAINKKQVKNLVESIGENIEIVKAIPLIVNDKMQIIDGQHRFEALKKLGLPIWYYRLPGLSLKDVQVMNSATKIWTPLDYAKSFAEMGNKNYKTYLEFRKKYGFIHYTLLLFFGVKLTGGKSRESSVANFRKGKLEIKDPALADKLCQQLKDIQKFYDRGDRKVFAKAFLACATNPNYNHSKMMEKIKKHPDIFQDTPYAEDYMRQMEKIYNYQSGANRVKLF